VTIDVEEAGRLLGISRNAAYAAAKTGVLPSLRIGKRVVIPRDAFDRFLESANGKSSNPIKG
jgi:excisionase family DNA binding protein